MNKDEHSEAIVTPIVTIMAPLTPIQSAPVIVIRLSGSVSELCFSLFGIKDVTPRVATRATFVSKVDTNITDDVILIFYKAPHSYTGEDVLEVSFHGNPIIAYTAMKDFSAFGVRMAERGEFTRRAYLNGKLTNAQAVAVNALISAHTARGVKIASNSLYGYLDTIFSEIRSSLLKNLANYEAAIDFADDTGEEIGDAVFDDIRKCAERFEMLLSRYASTQVAVNGVQVVLAGAPNAGKSTLFNALLGVDRAIVTDEAGTTRDTLHEALQFGGVNIILTDTAGLREAVSKAEVLGIERSAESIKNADIIVLLLDLSAPNYDALELTAGRNRIIVGNKQDLVASNAIDVDIKISAKSGDGVLALRNMIAERAAELVSNSDGDDEPALLSYVQYVECGEALENLNEILSAPLTIDIQAHYLRNAVAAMDRAEGGNLSEEVLDTLFASFCIGK